MRRFLLRIPLRLATGVVGVTVATAIEGWDGFPGACIAAGVFTLALIVWDWLHRPKPPMPEPDWVVWDEELDAHMSPTERAMLREGLVKRPTATDMRQALDGVEQLKAEVAEVQRMEHSRRDSTKIATSTDADMVWRKIRDGGL